MATFGERFKNGWNAFMGRDPTYVRFDYGSYSRPDRRPPTIADARSIVTSIYNRLAVDASQINIKHVKVDEDGNYLDTIHSSLNDALSIAANIDQTGRDFIQEAVQTMLEEGCAALVPTDTSKDPMKTDSYDIYQLRVGIVKEWMPEYVRLSVYRQSKGQREEIILPKKMVAIAYNPFFATMNEPNSELKRLIRTIAQLEETNRNIGSGKLDLILQLPYLIKSDKRRAQANARRQEIEDQLNNAKYGIAWTDGTEHVVQLNRPIDNNLWTQVQEQKLAVYNQLGLTQKIFDGTASEQEMLNYFNQTLLPILSTLTESMIMKWLTKTAITQGQSIMFFRDPFKLIPVNSIAEIGDKFTRNEIMTSNELRAKVGMKPSDDPRANQLRNANLNHPDEEGTTSTVAEEVVEKE